jgi:hypothetical protein
MNIAGYEEEFPDDVTLGDLLFDASELADGPAFWAAHFLRQGYDEDVVLSGFGVAEEAAQEAFDHFVRADRWPTFRIDIGGGRAVVVVYRNFEEDLGVDYLLETADGSLRLAALEGDFRGPGISWPETVAVAGRGNPDEIDAATLLLLLPMGGDADAGEHASVVVEVALREVGADGAVSELADLLVTDHPMWELAHWTSDSGQETVCDGEYSPRNPAGEVYVGVDFSLMPNRNQ